MTSFYLTTTSSTARTLLPGEVGLIGPNAVLFAATAPAVTMNPGALLSVTGLLAHYGGGFSPVRIEGASLGTARVVVAKSGSIVGSDGNGIGTSIDGSLFVKNSGEITAGTAIAGTVGRNFDLVNTGVIVSNFGAAVAIMVDGVATILNRGDIAGISIGGTGWLRLENTGIVSGAAIAVSGTEQADTVRNRGTIEGAVNLRGGNDRFDGRGGVSGKIDGGAGNDTLISGGWDDELTGGAGVDQLRGGGGDDALLGGDGNDLLQGGGGDDLLYGGSGDDTLTGGAGDDRVFGGSGADLFVFRRGHGNDVIEGFVNNHDKLDLRFFAVTAAELKASYAKASGAGVLIDLREPGGGTIQVNGSNMAALDAGDLIL
jgi:Ca2+-binding RTX toxin-like protein